MSAGWYIANENWSCGDQPKEVWQWMMQVYLAEECSNVCPRGGNWKGLSAQVLQFWQAKYEESSGEYKKLSFEKWVQKKYDEFKQMDKPDNFVVGPRCTDLPL